MNVAGARSRVICVGHAAFDRVFAVDSWPAGSAKIPAHRYDESGGGMAANAAAAVARLGGVAEFWGPTGDDAVADAIRTQLIADGVDATNLRRFAGRTSSHSAVIVDARGERLVVGLRGTALQAPADWLPLERIASAGALLADVRWPEGAHVALQAAREAGIPAILDGEIASREILETLARVADHVIFSQRGLDAFAGDDVQTGLRQAIDHGACMAAVTQGEAGVSWIDARAPANLQRCPAFPVAVVDTLAAGDVFHGAYALALAEGAKSAQAMRFACAAAAVKCSRSGGRSGAPNRTEVEALLVDAAVGGVPR
ncbi:MAG TPA: PfkB family carbohydrate kinase [Burkholderiales bacterium]|nr:PfkB family carbohydrate kinase [Burkholderiales bacterium]